MYCSLSTANRQCTGDANFPDSPIMGLAAHLAAAQRDINAGRWGTHAPAAPSRCTYQLTVSGKYRLITSW